ncbi:H(+)-transporting V1 sector ATPase subunit H, partial [Spiromyces aspiralis]
MALSSPHSAQLPTSTGSPSRAVNKEIKVPDVPPVFVTNEYFDDYTWDILHRAISWEGYRNAELITEQEYEVLSQYRNARTPSEYKVSDPDAFVSSLVKLLNKISRVEILLYLLAIID